MSQVIVTQDRLRQRREASGQQERTIEREAEFAKWRRSDITGRDPVAAAVGFAVLPIVALWGLLCGLMVIVLEALRAVFWVFGRVLGGAKNLLLGP